MGKKTLRKQQRLDKAKHWIPTYSGTKIVRGYRKKFAVDILTALRELQEFGVKFEPEYIASLENSEKHRVLQQCGQYRV